MNTKIKQDINAHSQKNKIITVTTILLFTLIMLLPGTTTAQDAIPEYFAEIRLPWRNNLEWAPILSFEYAEQQPETASARAASKVQMADIIVNKWVDEDSPRLFVECAKGAKYTDLKIQVNIGEGEQAPRVMEIRLEDVSITSYAVRGESGTELPQESFTISYGKIYYYYYYPDGSSIYSAWNLEKNKQI